MNILLVVQYFPPNSGGGRAYRAAKLVKYWTRHGCRVAVICSDRVVDSDLTLLAGVDESLLQILRCREPSVGTNRLIVMAGRHLFVADGQYLLGWRLLDTVLKAQIGWIPDIVVTSSAPYEVHAVGGALKRMFGFRWVADFRDPFTLNYHYRKWNPLSRLCDRWFEKEIYANADGIIFNTFHNRHETVRDFRLPLDDRRFTVCQNGYDPEETVWIKGNIRQEPFVISYIGGVRGDEPESEFVKLILWNTSYLKQRKIVFRLIGNGSNLFQRHASESDGTLEVIGFCTQSDLRRYWGNSSALLLLLPHSRDYLGWVPQKLYSYLGSRLPVLALVPDGEARDYLLESGGHVVRHPNDRDLPGMISQLIEVCAQGSATLPSKTVERFSQANLYRDLLAWLKTMTAQ